MNSAMFFPARSTFLLLTCARKDGHYAVVGKVDSLYRNSSRAAMLQVSVSVQDDCNFTDFAKSLHTTMPGMGPGFYQLGGGIAVADPGSVAGL